MKFRGYRQRQVSGPCLVTIMDEAGDEQILGLPKLGGMQVRHSHDGYQWGYSGSGPAELARAILVAAIPDDDRVRYPMCYQRFKQEWIASIKADEFELDVKDVREWYEQWLVKNPTVVERGWLS